VLYQHFLHSFPPLPSGDRPGVLGWLALMTFDLRTSAAEAARLNSRTK
jgi:hypothetical protein